MQDLSFLTRWDANHFEHTKVLFDHFPDDVAADADNYTVVVTDACLAKVFGRNHGTRIDVIRTRLFSQKNNVFYLYYDGTHFAIMDKEPSNHYVGLLVVPELNKDRETTLNDLQHTFNEKRILAYVAGDVYEAFHNFGNRIVDSCSGLYDQDKARDYYKRSAPNCRYTDDDFIETDHGFVLKSAMPA